jgi:DNA polymerase-1
MRLLFDADIIAFKAAAAVERPIKWGDGLWTLHAYEHEAIDHCLTYISNVKRALIDWKQISDYTLYLTGPNNWRKDILPTYKENRKDTRKPLVLPAVRQWMIEEQNAVLSSTLEADDLLGIHATANPLTTIIVSEDKDLQTIPALLYNPAKDTAVRHIGGFEAAYNHMHQTLTGDKTDNYDGLAGCGPVTATKILAPAKEPEDLWPLVVAAFKKKNLSEEHALVQAQVARICHASDLDKSGKVIPWTPM